jgi:CHAT domain-containing protein
MAEETLDMILTQPERARSEPSVNLLKARMQINRKQYVDAESVLKKNLFIYSEAGLRLSSRHIPSLMFLARIYSETDRVEEARNTFRNAIDVAEVSDDYLRAEKLRIAFDDERRDLYDSAIAFEYRHGNSDMAWNYLQKYRAKLFLEFLANFDPKFDALRTQMLNRSAVQKLIPDGAQVIEYVLLNDQMLIWVASPGLFTSRSVTVRRETIEQRVQEILAKFRADGDSRELSAELYDWLIAPIEELLDPKAAIVIVPDRALHGLPFAALRNPRTGQYLIQRFPIVISPSLTYLLATNVSSPRRDSIVSFGAKVDDVTSAREFTALRRIYTDIRTFTGKHVNKSSFLDAMESAPIFHYAGHSAKDAIDPLRSSILLDGHRYGPNAVTAVDIAGRRLKPNTLVVLSSCDSSVGNSRDGVGMRGLTSAFLIAGAGSVVGSLWPVEASGTSELMIRFHRSFVSSRAPVAHALRQAQLSFIESGGQHGHPYYWSSFVVTGNFSALR